MVMNKMGLQRVRKQSTLSFITNNTENGDLLTLFIEAMCESESAPRYLQNDEEQRKCKTRRYNLSCLFQSLQGKRKGLN